MKKVFLFITIFYSSFAFCLSDETTQNPKNKFHLQNQKIEKKEVKNRRPYQDDMDLGESINKSYYKVLIKQRSKLKPDEYHYTEVKSKKDLQKAGVIVKKGKKAKKVMNYVEIKNVKENPFLKKQKSKNVGVVVEKKAKTPRKILNIVDIKNSNFSKESVNVGVEVKKRKFHGNIINSVKVKNSNLGEEE